MSIAPLVRAVEEEHVREDVPMLQPGDTVRVHAKVVEGNRERIQVFEGIVIRLRGEGLNRNFTVRPAFSATARPARVSHPCQTTAAPPEPSGAPSL